MTEPAGLDVDPTLARKMWRTLEPYHGMIYFTPRATEAYAGIGVTGRSGYFASRVSPMGAVTPAVVVATFYNFDPGLVNDAMRDVWSKASPAALVAARFDAADRALRDLLDGGAIESPEMAEAAELARAAAEACTPEGRPLYAATAALDWPTAPHLALWHAITLLREFRGDGHLAALVHADLDGCQALITHAGGGEVTREILQTSRAWSDDDWEAALARLRNRGLIAADSEELTDAGREVRDGIEASTDHLALAPWRALGADRCDRLRALVRPWSKAIVSNGVFLRPPS